MTRSRRATVAALAAAVSLLGVTSCSRHPAGGDRFTIGLTYTPNIQFAPFYVAAAKGYYRSAGLDVALRHHGASEGLFTALASGHEDVVEAGGDEMMQGRATGVPVVDIATLFQTYPVALMVPAGSSIAGARDLRGHSIGVPGPYGESYFGLLALLQQAGLSTKNVTIKNIGFTQVAALTAKRVDAVMGYVNNEAVQFAAAGHPVRTIRLAGGASPPLIGVGLGALTTTLTKRGAEVRKLVAATLRGQRYMTAHPDEAITLSEKYVPGLADTGARAQAAAVLAATIPLLRSARAGYHSPEAWSAMATFMRSAGLLTKPVTATDAYSNAYLPATGG